MPADYTTYDEIGRRFNIDCGHFRKFDNAIRALGESTIQPGTGRRNFDAEICQTKRRTNFVSLAATEFVIRHEFPCSTATRQAP